MQERSQSVRTSRGLGWRNGLWKPEEALRESSGDAGGGGSRTKAVGAGVQREWHLQPRTLTYPCH